VEEEWGELTLEVEKEVLLEVDVVAVLEILVERSKPKYQSVKLSENRKIKDSVSLL
jgi:hypothetical protein